MFYIFVMLMLENIQCCIRVSHCLVRHKFPRASPSNTDTLILSCRTVYMYQTSEHCSFFTFLGQCAHHRVVAESVDVHLKLLIVIR